jgi:photosystem II stability/assembly factor-like uncharacterized protein
MGFFLSEDGGQTWTNVLPMNAWTVTIDPVSPLKTYATTGGQGVFRSSDGGHTWQPINSGLTNLSMGQSAPVIIDPTNHETLYVASEGGGGVFKSLDGGDHWFPVNLGLSDLSVFGLAMDPVNPAVLYACGLSGVFKTVTGAEAGVTIAVRDVNEVATDTSIGWATAGDNGSGRKRLLHQFEHGFSYRSQGLPHPDRGKTATGISPTRLTYGSFPLEVPSARLHLSVMWAWP